MNTIKKQVKKYLAKEGKSLTEVVELINSEREIEDKTTPQNINNKLTRGTIKFSEMIEIANALGYEIVWKKKVNNILYSFPDSKEINMDEYQPNNYDSAEQVIDSTFITGTGRTNYARLKKHPRDFLIEQEIQKFLNIIINLIYDIDLPDSSFKSKFDSLISELNSSSYQILILNYYTTLHQGLLLTNCGNEFLPTLTYIRNIFVHGGIHQLSIDEKQNLIELLQYFNTKYYDKKNF